MAGDDELQTHTEYLRGEQRPAVFGGKVHQMMSGSSGQGTEAQSDSPEGSTGPGDAPFTRKRGPQSSTGPGASPFAAVQAPNRPK